MEKKCFDEGLRDLLENQNILKVSLFYLFFTLHAYTSPFNFESKQLTTLLTLFCSFRSLVIFYFPSRCKLSIELLSNLDHNQQLSVSSASLQPCCGCDRNATSYATEFAKMTCGFTARLLDCKLRARVAIELTKLFNSW